MKKFISNLLKGRLFGHPVHMMLIHFPSALFPASLIADFTAIIFNDNTFFIFSFYAAAAGVIFGFAALIFGVIDLLKLPSDVQGF